MSELRITAAPGTLEMLTELLHIDRNEAETALAKIAQAVVDKGETEADNGT